MSWLWLIALGFSGPDAAEVSGVGPAPAADPAPPTLRRLTRAQYDASVRALLGGHVALPTSLEPDGEVDELLSVGAGVTAVSSLGVERYESAAYLLADQVDPVDVLPCEPANASDAGCARAFVEDFGRRAWRRPLTEIETERVAGIVTGVGLRYGVAALLQSPHFLYRVETSQAGALSGYEVATRLAYLLWGEPPDDALLDRAAVGELDTARGVGDVAREMLDDPRAEAGVRAFVDEWLHLYRLADLKKDPAIFDHASPDLGA